VRAVAVGQSAPKPAWLTEATPTTLYLLIIQQQRRDGEVEFDADIELTLEEYESLKRHLGKLLGLNVGTPLPRRRPAKRISRGGVHGT
jgi:hypothetical protein